MSKPKTKKARYVQIQLQDEAPALGCGMRIVKLEMGRKWAYCTAIASGAKARLPVALIERLKPTDVKVRKAYKQHGERA